MTVRAAPGTSLSETAGPRPSLAVAYDVTSSSPLELVESVGDAYGIVWVVEASDPALGSWARLLPRLGPVVDVAGRDATAVAADLATLGVDGVVAFTDSQLLTASLLGAALGLEGNPPEVVEALTDKAVQRRALAGAGLDGPRFASLPAGTTPEEARRILGGFRFPVVVKPQRGSGSQDTFPAQDGAALDAYLAGALGPDGSGGDLVVEEWLDDAEPRERQVFGDYVSVEAVARRGIIVPLAVTGKFPLGAPCRETGNFLPHHLDEERAADVVDLAVDAARALGVVSGALHIEVKLTPSGPRVIEVNGRVGGGGIDALYAATYGRSLSSVAAAVALGEPVDLGSFAPDRESGTFAYAYFVQPPIEARRLTGLDHLDAVLALEGVLDTSVNRSIGDRLDWRDGSQGYLLSVRGTADGLEALGRVPAQVRSVLSATFE